MGLIPRWRSPARGAGRSGIILILLSLAAVGCFSSQVNQRPANTAARGIAVQAAAAPPAGTLSLVVDMPALPRDVPPAKRVTALLTGRDLREVELIIDAARQQATAVIDNLPSGQWRVQVSIYDATGWELAAGTAIVEVRSGEIQQATIAAEAGLGQPGELMELAAWHLEDATDYWPLAAGNSWLYRVQTYQHGGHVSHTGLSLLTVTAQLPLDGGRKASFLNGFLRFPNPMIVRSTDAYYLHATRTESDALWRYLDPPVKLLHVQSSSSVITSVSWTRPATIRVTRPPSVFPYPQDYFRTSFCLTAAAAGFGSSPTWAL